MSPLRPLLPTVLLGIACVLEPDVVGGGTGNSSGTAAATDATMGDDATSTGVDFPAAAACGNVEDCVCAESPCAFVCEGLFNLGCSFVCEGPRDCQFTCPAGGCSSSCRDGARCDLPCEGSSCVDECIDAQRCEQRCAGGTCQLDCMGTDDCVVACPGGGCRLDCTGATSCRITECTQGCQLDCQGATVCDNSCGEAALCTTFR